MNEIQGYLHDVQGNNILVNVSQDKTLFLKWKRAKCYRMEIMSRILPIHDGISIQTDEPEKILCDVRELIGQRVQVKYYVRTYNFKSGGETKKGRYFDATHIISM